MLIEKIINKLFSFSGIVILTLPFTFFSINSILGIEYKGMDSNNSYLFVIITSWLIFFVSSLLYGLKKKFTFIDFFLFSLPLLVIINASYSALIFDIDTYKTSIQFILLCFPCFIYGMLLKKKLYLIYVHKSFFYVAIINTISVFFIIPKIIFIPTNELTTFFGGGHYQSFSYTLSFTFLVLLIYYLFHEKKINLKLYFYIILFIVLLIGIFLSGGRGGILVVIVGSILVIIQNFSFFKVIKILIFSLFMLLFSYILLVEYFSIYNDRFFESTSRLFSFISETGIDIEQTSNRDIVYKDAVSLIINKPIFGYGFFSYRKYTDGAYPHNIFLEILLQGGFIFFLFFLLFLFILFYNFVYLVRQSNKHRFLYATFVYSFIQLLFSATYVLEPIFWFNIAYILSPSSEV